MHCMCAMRASRLHYQAGLLEGGLQLVGWAIGPSDRVNEIVIMTRLASTP